MAAKKDAPADDPVAEYTDDPGGEGYPEASDTGEDHAADVGAPDSVGEAVDATVNDDPSAPPPPITPATPQADAQRRVLYEDQVNAASRAFGEQAAAAYIDAAVNGQTISLVTSESE